MKTVRWLVFWLFFVSFSVEASSDQHYPARSSQSTYPKGLKAFYTVLSELNPHTQRWWKPLTFLDEAEVGTIILCEPTHSLGYREKTSLERWRDRGGRAILLCNHAWYDREHEEEDIEVWNNTELFVFADEVSNAGLREPTEEVPIMIHMLLETPGPIYFDEFHLGISDKRSLLTNFFNFLGTPWGFALLQLLLAGGLYLLYRLSIRRKARWEEKIQERPQNLHKRIERLEKLLQKAGAQEFCKKFIQG